MKERKKGRPIKRVKRDTTIQLRVSESEYMKILEKVESSGFGGMSDYIRFLALNFRLSTVKVEADQ